VPFDNYSNESLSRLESASTERQSERTSAECYNRLSGRLHPNAPARSIATLVPIEIVQLTFDDLKDPAERAFFLGIPTTFALPAATAGRLRDVAGQLLRESKEFQQILLELRFQAKETPLHCLDQ